MEDIREKLDAADWAGIQQAMNDRGFVVIDKVLTDGDCEQLIQAYDDSDRYRKTVIMERYRFGLGEYKYFRYPLPAIIQDPGNRLSAFGSCG